jgi:hypothetical protein
MTLGQLIEIQRPRVQDESVGIRRSWEETFRYATKYFPPETPLKDFDLDVLSDRLASSGMQQQFVEGYVSRWRRLLEQQQDF